MQVYQLKVHKKKCFIFLELFHTSFWMTLNTENLYVLKIYRPANLGSWHFFTSVFVFV